MRVGEEEFIDPFKRGARGVRLWTARYDPLQAGFDAVFACQIYASGIELFFFFWESRRITY